MTTLVQSWTLGKTCLDIYDDGIVTVFPGVGDLEACPQDNDEYRATALRLGYGGDLLLMCQEHEATHTLLAVMMGLPRSPTLFGVVTGNFWPHYRTEEAAVLAFQANCRATGVSILGDLLGRYHLGV